MLFDHFAFTEICKELKLERACGALPVPMEVLLTSLQLSVLVVN